MPQTRIPDPDEVVQTRIGQVVRVVLYAMLFLSAAGSVFFGDKLWTAAREGALPLWAPLLAPAAFTGFVALYAIDRWLLVRRRNYPVSRAIFQIALALVFGTLLLPQQASELRQLRHWEITLREPALQLLAYPDEVVRAATCELLGGRVPVDLYERVNNTARNDPSAHVREACTQAFLRLHSHSEF